MQSLPESDLRFLADFEDCRMTAAEFGHREHVRVAYIYLSLHPFEIARTRIENGLRQLLAHFGAPPAKYHETLTRAWLLAVQHFLQASGPTTGSAQFLHQNAALLAKEIMETHYTKDRLGSEEARRHFVEPDLQPIPRAAG